MLTEGIVNLGNSYFTKNPFCVKENSGNGTATELHANDTCVWSLSTATSIIN